MKITAGLGSIDEYERFVQAGCYDDCVASKSNKCEVIPEIRKK